MRRAPVLLSLVAVMLLAVFAVGSAPNTSA